MQRFEFPRPLLGDDVLFIEGRPRVQQVQRELPALGEYGFQAAVGFIALLLALSLFILQPGQLFPLRMEPFALLGEVQLLPAGFVF